MNHTTEPVSNMHMQELPFLLTNDESGDRNAHANGNVDEDGPSALSPAGRNRARARDLVQTTVDDEGCGKDRVWCGKQDANS